MLVDTPLRWGILGTGAIARQFTADLLTLPDHAVVAVGSRSAGTAEAFATAHGIPRAHASYQALADDTGVDVVYVATPHPGHAPAALTCLKAGRGVLIEKPFTMDAAEAVTVVTAARAAGVFCMEAMWTRFNPAVVRVAELVAAGAIGEVVAVQSDFGFAAWYDPTSRLFAPELGGGALLDVGVYPISLVSMFLGEPATVVAAGGTAPTGVDTNVGVVLGYPSGAVGMVHCSFRTETPQRTVVLGAAGRIELAPPAARPDALTLYRSGQEPLTETFLLPGAGYTFQAQEVARRVRAGQIESAVMPLDESIAIMRTLDRVRAAVVG